VSEMTWKQFKDEVDARLKANGVPETVVIGFIDVCGWNNIDEVKVVVDEPTQWLEVLS
jgi:hypothetical protein